MQEEQKEQSSYQRQGLQYPEGFYAVFSSRKHRRFTYLFICCFIYLLVFVLFFIRLCLNRCIGTNPADWTL